MILGNICLANKGMMFDVVLGVGIILRKIDARVLPVGGEGFNFNFVPILLKTPNLFLVSIGYQFSAPFCQYIVQISTCPKFLPKA